MAACIIFSLFTSAPGFAEQQTYVVKKGDSLYKVGKLFNTTPDALKKLNNLRNDRLDIGQILKVSPNQSLTPEVQPAAGSVAANNSEQRRAPDETQNYTVRRGDTLSKIALSFKISVRDIANANNIANTNRLSVGRVLIIPGKVGISNITTATSAESAQIAKTPATQGLPKVQQQAHRETQTYTVRMGDTISRIATSFGIGVNDIVAANNLRNNNRLSVGQVLTIPGENKTSTNETLVVRAVSTQSVNTADSKPSVNENGDLSTRDRLVEAGFNLLGVRYRYGGTSEKTGLDCSALVKNLFEKFGFSLPRSSREQYKHGEKVAKEDLQKGDLVFFSSSGKTPTHVGIYIGGNQFLHAASRAKKVVVSDLGRTWYDIRYLGARRIVGLWIEDVEIPLGDTRQESLTVSVNEDNASAEEFASHVTSTENQ